MDARGWEQIQSIGSAAGAGALGPSVRGGLKARLGEVISLASPLSQASGPRVLGQEGHMQKKVAVHFPGGQAEGQHQGSLAPYLGCYLRGWCCLERKAISAMTLTVIS